MSPSCKRFRFKINGRVTRFISELWNSSWFLPWVTIYTQLWLSWCQRLYTFTTWNIKPETSQLYHISIYKFWIISLHRYTKVCNHLFNQLDQRRYLLAQYSGDICRPTIDLLAQYSGDICRPTIVPDQKVHPYYICLLPVRHIYCIAST